MAGQCSWPSAQCRAPAAIVALDDGDHLGGNLSRLHKAADAQRALKAERDVGQHLGELLAELLAVQAMLAGAVPAVLRSN